MNARRKLLVAIGAGVLTMPLASLGQQQSKVARIGYLAGDSMTVNPHSVQAFRDGLHELGYVEGKNLIIEYRTLDAGRATGSRVIGGESRRESSLDFQCAVKGAVSQWAVMPTRQLSLLPVAVGAVVIRPT